PAQTPQAAGKVRSHWQAISWTVTSDAGNPSILVSRPRQCHPGLAGPVSLDERIEGRMALAPCVQRRFMALEPRFVHVEHAAHATSAATVHRVRLFRRLRWWVVWRKHARS